MKYVTDIKVHSADYEALEHEFNDLKIAEWAKDKGFEAFLVRDGVCFKGNKFVTLSNEHMEETDCFSVSLNQFRHNDGWDICNVKNIDFRMARD